MKTCKECPEYRRRSKTNGCCALQYTAVEPSSECSALSVPFALDEFAPMDYDERDVDVVEFMTGGSL